MAASGTSGAGSAATGAAQAHGPSEAVGDRAPTHRDLPVAVTLGDPSGIGPEITLKAWRHFTAHGTGPVFFVIGPISFFRALAAASGDDVDVAAISQPHEAAVVFPSALPVLDMDVAITGGPGAPQTGNATAIVGSIDRAVGFARTGDIAGLVTNPIAKAVLYKAGFQHPGHTEYLAQCAGRLFAQTRGSAALSVRSDGATAPRPVMMLAAGAFRVVPATIHIPLAAVPAALNPGLITETCRIVADELVASFGCACPRLAVAGLNPHAGEDATLGTEERDLIGPALDLMRAEGLDVAGPLPADTMFHPSARARYDAAITMYHDQALIPIKTVAFDSAVNVTLGLPFVRTSPDHGTAFDIAGRGVADPTSLIEAIKLAAEIAANRARAAQGPQSGDGDPVPVVGAQGVGA